jgi:DNA polymerase III delta subunit
VRSSWQAGNLMRSARQFDLKWCRNAVALAAETDLAMKSTGIDREELLTDLLLKLAAG